MDDDRRLKRPEDPSKININKGSEIAYWANKFGVSEDIIVGAVETVGDWLVDVKMYLGK